MARKYKSSRKYNYNQGSKTKKTILIISIVLAVVLILTAGVFAVINTVRNMFNAESDFFMIQKAPEKTTYFVGESPSWYGLEAKLVTAEGNTVVLGPESCIITGFDSSKPVAEQTITVKYKDLTAYFTVSIIAEDQGSNGDNTNNGDNGNNSNNSGSTNNNGTTGAGKLVKLTFKTLPKTNYKVGEYLSISGGILLRHYEDGSTAELKLNYDMVRNFDNSAPGTYTLTVMYFEDTWVSTTYDITVTE